MKKHIFETVSAMGAAAAECAAGVIQRTLQVNDECNIILATGASQFEMLSRLVGADIDWSRVNMFHLDEYAGMSASHPASFRNYLQERFVARVNPLKSVTFVNGDADDVQEECRRLGQIIADHPIDAAMVGIGENGHLAFNDPPADFETESPYIVVTLDEACRRQQMGEGWFAGLEDVPRQAISMSIRQILKSKHIIVTVPDRRKAKAVRDTLVSEVSPMVPASILQTHPDCTVFLDRAAASLLCPRYLTYRIEFDGLY
jgi:glucosamine-6-phosphate deaminase